MEGLSHVTNATPVENFLPIAAKRRKSGYTRAGMASTVSLMALAAFGPKVAEADVVNTWNVSVTEPGTSNTIAGSFTYDVTTNTVTSWNFSMPTAPFSPSTMSNTIGGNVSIVGGNCSTSGSPPVTTCPTPTSISIDNNSVPGSPHAEINIFISGSSSTNSLAGTSPVGIALGVVFANGTTYPPVSSTITTSPSQPAIVLSKTLGDTGALCGCGPYTPSTPSADPAVGEPITLGTGNVYVHEVDYRNGVPGGVQQNALTFERFYNSLGVAANPGTSATMMGKNWRTNFDRGLSVNSSGGVVNFVTAERPDGQLLTFTPNGSGGYASDTDVDFKLSQSGSTWTLTDRNDTVETYTDPGTGKAQLNTIKLHNGYTQTLSYTSGHLSSVTDSYFSTLSFGYSGNLLTQVTTPGDLILQYTYDSSGTNGTTVDRLTQVVFNTTPSFTRKTYNYDPTYPLGLSNVVNENGVADNFWSYDTQGRAISSGGALISGVQANRTTISYDDATGNRTVTNALGEQETYKFTVLQGTPKLTEIDRTATTGIPAATRTFTYDTNGYRATETDWNGNTTAYTNNSHGQPTSITEAYGTPLARTTTITYDATFIHLPAQIVEPTRTTNITYDANGNVHTNTVTDTLASNPSRTWTYTWNSTGELLTATGPRTDVTSTTTNTYDTHGVLATTTDALGHVTTVDDYDNDLRITSITDPNGLNKAFTYDIRGNLLTTTLTGSVFSETTTLTRDANENVTKVTNPDNSSLTYTLDNAHRLTKVTNSLNEHINYTLDLAGNRTAVNVYDSTNALNRSHTSTFDALSRQKTDVDALSNTTTYGYDNNGNRTSVTDPLSEMTAYAYDQLNRVKTVTDPTSNVTTITYSTDTQNLVAQVTDPRTFVTQYTYNGFGNLTQLSSPDSGLTSYTYDRAGDVATKMDSKGQTTTNTYDALNRLTNAAYADSTHTTFTWDTATNGIGKLASATGRTGDVTNLSYDVFERMSQEQQILNGGRTFNVGYNYDLLSGNLNTLTYPSGLTVGYGHDAAGQVSSLSVNSSTFISGIKHQPFGEVKSWTWASGSSTSYARTFDSNGRLATYPLASDTRTVNYDAVSRVSTVADSVGTQTFGYDADSRINSYSAPGSVVQSYNYDANGNRSSQTLNGGTTTYSVNSINNTYNSYTKPTGVTVPYTFDANGSMTAAGSASSSYNALGQQTGTTIGSSVTTYTQDAFGRRVVRSGSGGGWFNQFDINGDNLGDYSWSSSGTTIIPGNETIRIPSNAGEPALPVGIATNGASATPPTMFRTYAGHLSEPRAVTDSSNNLRWTWPMNDAYGNTAANQNPAGLGNFQYNLRWPGQAYDPESGNMYNQNRYYAPSTGRYIQSDPIGLSGAVVGSYNTYTYVGSSVPNGIDPTGTRGWLEQWLIDQAKDYARDKAQEAAEKAATKGVVSQLTDNPIVIGGISQAVPDTIAGVAAGVMSPGPWWGKGILAALEGVAGAGLGYAEGANEVLADLRREEDAGGFCYIGTPKNSRRYNIKTQSFPVLIQ